MNSKDARAHPLTSNAIDREIRSAVPTLGRSVLMGAIGFSLVSLVVFGTVAYGQMWMYQRLGITGAYLVWIALFIVLGGVALRPLVVGPSHPPKFYALFGAAFLAYGISWMMVYFALKMGLGEWLASLAGSIAMAVVFCAGLKTFRSLLLFSLVLFVANSIGYFLGSTFYYSIGRPSGLILWGAFYGACLGAGIGAVLHLAQANRWSSEALE